MDYFEYHLYFNKAGQEFVADLLTDYLSDYGFDSFADADDGLLAYHPAPALPDETVQTALQNFEYASGVSFEKKLIASQNWNETWEQESNTPQVYGGQCVVHSPAYADVPKVKYDILIDPKLSFGSGHHQTTTLMIERMLSTQFTGKSVCDMGCGTAVLAILSKMEGATDVTAVDIDEWAYKNAKDNLALNGISDIDLRLGGYEALPQKHFDYFLANINRNILLEGIPHYSQCMHSGSFLYLSGFYVEDIPVVDGVAEPCGLERQEGYTEKDNWVCVVYKKL